MTASATAGIPKAFIWRRLHSLMGLWFLLFLIEHLLTNSQAALWIGSSGKGFVDMVNAIHNLPYLEVIELTLLGVPILLHAALGVKYLFTAKFNSHKTDGSAPSIPRARNRAYTWQRITSWILLVLLAFHVTKFRFLEYPHAVQMGQQTLYLKTVSMDEGLYTLANRLDVKLYDAYQISNEKKHLSSENTEETMQPAQEPIDFWKGPTSSSYSLEKDHALNAEQQMRSQAVFVEALEREHLKSGYVVAVCKDFGTASLLAVRDTFKSPFYVGLYTIFVLAACFHGCNGFWTFLLTWGWILKMAAQRAWVMVSVVLMAVLIFLGLAAVWGTYWINLRY